MMKIFTHKCYNLINELASLEVHEKYFLNDSSEKQKKQTFFWTQVVSNIDVVIFQLANFESKAYS